MMLEARVRTVDASEATVWVDARASRLMVNSAAAVSFSTDSSSSHSSSSNFCRRPFKQNFQMRKVAMRMNATPPTTPPAMAPTLGPSDFFDPESEEEPSAILMQIVLAQVLQEEAI